MRPHAPLALLAALALAACETPRESCLSSASRDLTVVESLIRETQGNISRGYAVERDQEVTVDRDFCRVEREDGSIRLRPCDRTRVENVRRPVAIDLRAEQASNAARRWPPRPPPASRPASPPTPSDGGPVPPPRAGPPPWPAAAGSHGGA